MANQLIKTGITTGQTIQPGHVTQSVDALTGTSAYDIKISGSLTLTGSVSSLNGFTGNLAGTSSWASNALISNTVRPSNTVSNFGYTVPYLSGTGSTATLYYSATGPTYNPTTETVNSANFSGSLSGTSTTVDYIQFNTGSTVTGQPGRIWWNNTDGTVNIRLNNNNVTLQVGQEQVTRVYNATGTPLQENEYKVIYISGSDALSGALKGYLAQADNINTAETTLGIVTENIAPNNVGYITTHGLVRGVNTSMFTAGDTLYLSSIDPGGVSNTRVAPPNLDIIVGYVVTSGPSGDIYVDVRPSYEYPQYVSAYSTSSISASSAGTEYIIPYTTSSLSSASYLTGSKFYVAKNGLYDVQYTIQINRVASSGTATVSVWLKKDGVNVPLTNRNFNSTGNIGTANRVGSSNYFITMTSGSYLELAWSTSDIAVILQALPSSSLHPATPSISATLNRVG